MKFALLKVKIIPAAVLTAISGMKKNAMTLTNALMEFLMTAVNLPIVQIPPVLMNVPVAKIIQVTVLNVLQTQKMLIAKTHFLKMQHGIQKILKEC